MDFIKPANILRFHSKATNFSHCLASVELNLYRITAKDLVELATLTKSLRQDIEFAEKCDSARWISIIQSATNYLKNYELPKGFAADFTNLLDALVRNNAERSLSLIDTLNKKINQHLGGGQTPHGTQQEY